MNASLQLFRGSYYALELRISVLTRLGHTGVPVLLALSWLPLFFVMELLWSSVKVSHGCKAWIFVGYVYLSVCMYVYTMMGAWWRMYACEYIHKQACMYIYTHNIIFLYVMSSSSASGQCWRKGQFFRCCFGWSSFNRCKYSLTWFTYIYNTCTKDMGMVWRYTNKGI